jgi:hypothetical protein
MSDDTIVKKVFLGKPEGKREAGRSKLRWLDSTENELVLITNLMHNFFIL